MGWIILAVVVLLVAVVYGIVVIFKTTHEMPEVTEEQARENSHPLSQVEKRR
jgi:hypothetical protein